MEITFSSSVANTNGFFRVFDVVVCLYFFPCSLHPDRAFITALLAVLDIISPFAILKECTGSSKIIFIPLPSPSEDASNNSTVSVDGVYAWLWIDTAVTRASVSNDCPCFIRSAGMVCVEVASSAKTRTLSLYAVETVAPIANAICVSAVRQVP